MGVEELPCKQRLVEAASMQWRPKRDRSAAELMRPVLWALGNKRRRTDPPAHSCNSGCEPTVDEQSTSIPCQYLQAMLFIKRRIYMESQDPRALLCCKALESELRRRVEITMATLQCSSR